MPRGSLQLLAAAALFACSFANARAAPAVDAAIALYGAQRYSEAEAALRHAAAAEPKNACACYYLGLTLRHRDGESSLVDAADWLAKAVRLAPDNAEYMYAYGQTCFQLADRKRSVIYATRGRDAMKRTIALNPNQLDARANLMEFYARAPWPLGSAGRALGQVNQISSRDPIRGAQANLRLAEIFEQNGDRADARQVCRAAVKLDPANAAAAAALARLAAP